MKLVQLMAVAATIVASATPAAANLLVNGNFEGSSAPTTTPPGWSNIGHIEGVIAYSAFSTPAYDGNYYYDIGGFGGPTPALGDGITQSVTTAIGSAYTLTFGYSGENTLGVSTILEVKIGSLSNLFTIIGTGAGIFKQPFTTASINYTATAASTPIAFTILSSTQVGFNDPLIDGVSFVASSTGAIPEPASWALMIVGFGAVGVQMRRRAPVAA